MKIALIGYGKMGKAIEEVALERGHEIVLKIDENNLSDFNKENIDKADVSIEFTGPHAAYDNLVKLFNFGATVVSGSTGWLDKLQEAQALCKEKNAAFIYASNFSVGVNLFFELNKKLAQLMHPHKQYTVTMEEIHHTQKKDAPSGTAITLAESILNHYPQKNNWTSIKNQNNLYIQSNRCGDEKGFHAVHYQSAIDGITLSHQAYSRKGFAVGAVIAAEFLAGKKGVFTMSDVLNIK